jgi:hypothetical protein
LRLREPRIGDGEDRVDCVDDEACQRTLRYKLRVVIKREKHVDRASPDRQRRHQTGQQGADALGGHRRRHHEAGGDGHFNDQREQEKKIGGHFV